MHACTNISRKNVDLSYIFILLEIDNNTNNNNNETDPIC